MGLRRWICGLACAASLLPRAARADVPASPVVQLTAQPARFMLSNDRYLGNLMLRELQRQAVLIAAREELGLRTRDLTLGEPFAPHQPGLATTVFCETRVTRADQADLCLSHGERQVPVDPGALADVVVDRPENADVQRRSFRLAKHPLVDYPAFVRHCELASRTDYLDALRAEHVLGDAAPRPTIWAGADAPADPAATALLDQLDCYSQYRALRLLHAQVRADGASPDRLSGLVRGYANLGQLAGNQWCEAWKAYTARSLLYAERLVAHEHGSPASLYARAYARSLCSLSAAALVDLESAAAAQGASPEPAWAALARSYARYDQPACAAAALVGPWRHRGLASLLSAFVAYDDYPRDAVVDATMAARAQCPGASILLSSVEGSDDERLSRLSDALVAQLPVVLGEQLRTFAAPPAVRSRLAQLVPKEDPFTNLAGLRDALASATAGDVGEPSLGALASLVQEQAFVGVASRTAHLRTGSGLPEALTFAQRAAPILSRHPWGPLVQAMGVDGSSDAKAIKRLLAKVRARDVGLWVDAAVSDLTVPQDPPPAIAAWVRSAALAADDVADDCNAAVATVRAGPATGGDLARYLALIRETSPCSATTMAAWMNAVPTDRVVAHHALYDDALRDVTTQFTNRPALLDLMCGWCEARGDFAPSLPLLETLDELEPTTDRCERLAETLRWSGDHEGAVACMLRCARLSGNVEGGYAYQRAAQYRIEDGQYAQALSYLQQSSDPADTGTLQCMARCYERMGQLDDAENCLRQAAALVPLVNVQQYLWAKRLRRPDAEEVHARAAAAVAKGADEYMPGVYLSLAEGQDRRAMDLLVGHRPQLSDATELAELVVLSTELKAAAVRRSALNDLGNSDAGRAFKGLVMDARSPSGLRAFNKWCDRQLDPSTTSQWQALAGRYLVAAGRPTEARACLNAALRQSQVEQEFYALATSALQRLDATASPTTRP